MEPLGDVAIRDVLRCTGCSLVQYRTQSGHCRRCDKPYAVVTYPAPAPIAPLPDNPSNLLVYKGYRQNTQKSFIPNVGQIIKNLRTDRLLNQDCAAALIGCTRPILSRIERGRHYPSVATLLDIAHTFRIPITVLISTDEESEILAYFSGLLYIDQQMIISRVRGWINMERCV